MLTTGLARKGWDEITPLEFANDDHPPLVVEVTDFNRAEHLDTVVRVHLLSI